jgi:hypothetical protein
MTTSISLGSKALPFSFESMKVGPRVRATCGAIAVLFAASLCLTDSAESRGFGGFHGGGFHGGGFRGGFHRSGGYHAFHMSRSFHRGGFHGGYHVSHWRGGGSFHSSRWASHGSHVTSWHSYGSRGLGTRFARAPGSYGGDNPPKGGTPPKGDGPTKGSGWPRPGYPGTPGNNGWHPRPIGPGPGAPVYGGPVINGVPVANGYGPPQSPISNGPSGPSGPSFSGPSSPPPPSGPPAGPGAGPNGPAGPARLGAGLPPAGEQRYVPNEVLIEMSGVVSDLALGNIASRYRLTRLSTLRMSLTNSTWVRWRIPDGRAVPIVVAALGGDASVRWAQPNYLYEIQQYMGASVRPDAHYEPEIGDPGQYALAKLHLGEAQTLARGSRVVVAVIDTEIDRYNPELAGTIVGSYDAFGKAAPMENHGTAIAGTIAAHAQLRGAAPDVSILAIRAFGGGRGTTQHLNAAIEWAVTHGANVINMSFAGPKDPGLERTINRAHDTGHVLVAAVGNKGPNSPPLYPAAYASVIGVTATDANDQLFNLANRGDQVAVAAPGVDIMVPGADNKVLFLSGTSFASAYVSGVAALILERRPGMSPDAVRRVLMSTAHRATPQGRDEQFGAGLIDAKEALLAVSGRPSVEMTRGLTQ